jgi:archaellin
MRLERRGEMGVSVMIIFIAMILVASAAASVLLATANDLREQATRTGADAIAGVSTGYELIYATGDVTGNEVTRLHLFLRPVPGSPNIDIGQVVITMTISSDGSTCADLVCDPKSIVERGNRVEVIISGLSACPGDKVTLRIMPPVGFSTYIELAIPDVLIDGTINLR